MSWYYAVGDEQKGPVEEEEFRALVSQGVITPKSLVWQEGMGDWKPLAEMSQAPSAQAGGGEADSATCAYSGEVMKRSEMIKYGDDYVAPQHKDAFVQRLQEGGPVSSAELRFAGFWIRFAAKMIDGIILSIVTGGPYWFLSFKVAMLGSQGNPDPEVIARYNVFLILAYLLMMVLQVAYAAFMVGKYGATLGKLAVGIRVVNADGSKVSYLKAFGRWWGELVTGFTIGIGYIIAGFDREKRALHDHICSTRVVFK